MTPFLLNLLCDPITKSELKLVDEVYDNHGNIIEGKLVSEENKVYPIKNGVPRFVPERNQAVESFGDEWNYFNFTDFKDHWLNHTVKNTFGSANYFKGKLIVDCGAGSGSQTKWFLEYGAQHVIALELSHSIDDVVQRNLSDVDKSRVDVIQCSIDAPPLKDNSILGIVYCHNVIQHTESVEKTAKSLFKIVAEKGEFVFNCYQLNDQGPIRWIRQHIIYDTVRKFLSKRSFKSILFYSRLMGVLRCIPFIGIAFEKMSLCFAGNVVSNRGRFSLDHLIQKYKSTVLNTFDFYGSHSFQHQKSDKEMKQLIHELQPQSHKVFNVQQYFQRPTPDGCALRVSK